MNNHQVNRKAQTETFKETSFREDISKSQEDKQREVRLPKDMTPYNKLLTSAWNCTKEHKNPSTSKQESNL